MSRRVFVSLSLALGMALLLAQSTLGLSSPSPSRVIPATSVTAAQHATVQASYGQLPLAFELNVGQADPAARFVAHGQGYTVALTPSEALLALTRQQDATTSRSQFALPGQPALRPSAPPSTLGMTWLGANPHPLVTGEQPLPGTVNYFIGSDPSQWHTKIPTYAQVRLHDVYPGVDLVYYGNQGQLEYDFVVASGANPAAIQLGFTGADRVGMDLAGNLSLALPDGAIAQQRPLIYQTVGGARQSVAGGFALTDGQRASFTVGAYNPHLPLVIDPAYKFSTYLGGSAADLGYAIAVDSAGDAYVTGTTVSTNFPTLNPVQSVNASLPGYGDVFVTKFNPAGTALIYSTYLGGNADDIGYAIALDSVGDVFVAGQTDSTNFPVLNALQSTPGTNFSAFVTKLTASGSGLWYSTYLGGNSGSWAGGIAVDGAGSAYVVGTTQATNFPTLNAFQTTNHGSENAFVTKFNAVGNGLVYSTYLGGSGEDWGSAIALDSSGSAYVTGYAISPDFPTTLGAFQPHKATGAAANAFVAKLSAAGSALTYSTYLGGDNATIPPVAPVRARVAEPYIHGIGPSGCGCIGEWGYGIVVDSSGDAYVTGRTDSHNFPITPGAFQSTIVAGGYTQNGFVTEFNATGSALIYSTFLSGTAGAIGYGIALDVAGNAYVTGYTTSSDFPTVNPLQGTLGNTNGDAFVTKLNSSGSALLYSSYLDGTTNYGSVGSGIALNHGRDVYVTGQASATDFPIKNAFQSTYAGGNFDAFVTKMRVWPSVDTTTGVFRPSNGVLYLKNANTTGPADITLYYGQPGDQPITGDWAGKGYKSIGIYRNGTFYLRNSNTTGVADIVAAFGASGDIPVAGDWTGKGYDSIGVYRPSNSTFYLRDSNSSGPPDHVVTLGISGDVPIVGDWTGKGWDSVGVFRPSNGIVYLRNSNTTGFADINFIYGIAGDKPVVGDWTAQGKDTIGVDRGGHFLLRNSNTTGPASISFYLGVNGDDPIAGPWLAPVGGVPPVHRGPSMPSRPTAGALLARRGAN